MYFYTLLHKVNAKFVALIGQKRVPVIAIIVRAFPSALLHEISTIIVCLRIVTQLTSNDNRFSFVPVIVANGICYQIANGYDVKGVHKLRQFAQTNSSII